MDPSLLLTPLQSTSSSLSQMMNESVVLEEMSAAATNHSATDSDSVALGTDIAQLQQLLHQQQQQKQHLYELLRVVIQLTQQSHSLGLFYHWTLYQKIIQTIAMSSHVVQYQYQNAASPPSSLLAPSFLSVPAEMSRSMDFQTMMDEIICCTNVMNSKQNQTNQNSDNHTATVTTTISTVPDVTPNENDALDPSVTPTMEEETQQQEHESIIASRNVALSSLFGPAYVSLIRAEAFTDTLELFRFVQDQYGLSIYDRDTTTNIYESIYTMVSKSFRLRLRCLTHSNDDEPITQIVSLLEPSVLSFRPEWERENQQRAEAYNIFVNAIDLDYFENVIDNIYDGKVTNFNDEDENDSDSDGDDDDDDPENDNPTDESDYDSDDNGRVSDDDDDDETSDEKRSFMLTVHRMITRRIQDETTKTMLEDILSPEVHAETAFSSSSSSSSTSPSSKKVPDVVVIQTPSKHGSSNIPLTFEFNINADHIIPISSIPKDTSTQKSSASDDGNHLDDTKRDIDTVDHNDLPLTMDPIDPVGHVQNTNANAEMEANASSETLKDTTTSTVHEDGDEYDDVLSDLEDDDDDDHDAIVDDRLDRFPDITTQFVEEWKNGASQSPRRQRRRGRRQRIEFTRTYEDILWTRSALTDNDDDDNEEDYDSYFDRPKARYHRSTDTSRTKNDNNSSDIDTNVEANEIVSSDIKENDNSNQNTTTTGIAAAAAAAEDDSITKTAPSCDQDGECENPTTHHNITNDNSDSQSSIPSTDDDDGTKKLT